MSDTDKLVAAILAGARCVATNAQSDHATYIAEYEKFFHMLEERHQAADEARGGSDIAPWDKWSHNVD